MLDRRPDRASAEAIRGASVLRQEPDTRTGVSSSDTPAMSQILPDPGRFDNPLVNTPGEYLGARSEWLSAP